MAACASVSLVALLAQVFKVLSMPFFLTIVGAPATVLLFGLAALARRLRADTLLRNLRVGLVAGAAATLAYDASRWLVQSTGWFHYDGFYAIRLFGAWITGSRLGSPQADVAGWIYHYWNGLSFAVLYVLAFGPRSWLLGVGYGLTMELVMLGIFPMFLPITHQLDFVVISLIGHVCFGAVLGVLAQQRAASWAAHPVRRAA